MRCLKFYAVGALGMSVHLALVAILVRVCQVEYQLATVLAVETSVLHNFAWHRKWTWADRPVSGIAAISARLLRFNLSNGLLSVLGNLFFMRLFVGVLHFDPIVSTLFSIVPCALLNFLVSNRWVFRNSPLAIRQSHFLEVRND